jgi:hypothetical protein
MGDRRVFRSHRDVRRQNPMDAANRRRDAMPTNWLTYEGTAVRRFPNGAYIYRTSHVALDADGSPRAYRPDDGGLDANVNAGYPHKGWRSVLAVDPTDSTRPYVQHGGPYDGYFVSKTSLRDPDGSDVDPATYVDAERVPYLVFPGDFYAIPGTGRYGDLAMARAVGTTHETAAIVADGGPAKAPLGEISLALATALGGAAHPNPRNGVGAPTGAFEYIIFPGSRFAPAWPRSFGEIDERARELLAAVGGWP